MTKSVGGTNEYTITAGGNDIWNAADACYYAYDPTPVTGDFDYVMRVKVLEGPDNWTKSELMARESVFAGTVDPLDTDAFIAQMTTRAGGQNQVALQWRPDPSAGANWFDPGTRGWTIYRPSYPNTWIRLRRKGQIFMNYISTDGVNWTKQEHLDTLAETNLFPNGALDNSLAIGIAVTSHSVGNQASNVVDNFGKHIPVAVSIVTQPPPTVNISANQALTLTVTAAGDPIDYQWTKDGANIAGAINATYSIPLAQTTNSGTYRCVVSGPLNSITSDPSVVTVAVDVTPPELASVTGDATFTAITVRYNEPIGDSALTTGNYQLAPAVGITAATRVDLFAVALTTAKMTPGTDYTLTVNNVQDTSGNTIAPNSKLSFKSFVWAQGFVSHKFWDNHTVNNVQALIDDPRFPDAPTWQSAERFFEYGPNGSNESGSNYGNQLFCWFTPAVSGSYTFIVSGDDECRLYLSTDDNPANKKYIAHEPQWNNARDWNGTARRPAGDNVSDTFDGSEWNDLLINLTAGTKYYVEALHSEGGGGDSVGATFRIGSDPIPANGTAPALTGNLVGTYLDPNGAVIDITAQPQSVATVANATATFTVEATGSSAYGTTLTYQWQKTAAGGSTFTDIAGATTASYTTPVLGTPNNNEKYRVVIGVTPITVNSAEATLTVTVDNIPPTIASVDSDDSFTKLMVKFSEQVTAPTATTAGNYTLSGGATVSAAALSTDRTMVTLTTSKLTDDTNYTLTVINVQDNAGNAIAANTTAAFHTWVWTVGKMKLLWWDNIGGTAVADLTNNVNYPNNWNVRTFVDGFAAPDRAGVDNFGGVLSGWITPKTTGTYVFFASGDDQTYVYLSTDDSPANKKLLAEEPQWNNFADWSGTARRPNGENRSDTYAGNQWGGPINLTAGNRYYAEIIYKDGTGGGHGAGAWIPAGAALPANGSTPLVGDLVATWAPYVPTEFDPNLTATVSGGSISITWDTGTLVGSGTVDGTYAPVQGATSPFTPPAGGNTMFYQVTQ